MLGVVHSSGTSGSVGIVVLILYFVPSLVALIRKLPNFGLIFVVNLVLGWTLIGWVWALVKALRSSRVQLPPELTTCDRCGSGLTPGQQFCFCGAPRTDPKS